MTGADMLKRARDLAYHCNGHGREGVATMLFDLINEIERLRDAASGSEVILNTAQAEIERLKKKVNAITSRKALTTDDLAEALSCFWNAAIGEAHNRQDSTAFAVASIMAKGFAAIEHRLRETDRVADTPAPAMTFDQFHNAIRVLWNIDRPDWMTAEQWFFFQNEPHRFFVIANDETARKLWVLVEGRLTRGGNSKIATLDAHTPGWRDMLHANGRPKFSGDGTMLDEHGNRSIFDDVDE